MATTNELYTQINELWEQFQENHRSHSEKGNKNGAIWGYNKPCGH